MNSDQQNRLQGELPSAHDEQFLQIRSEQLHHETVILENAARPEVVHFGDALHAAEQFVNAVLRVQLRRLRLYRFHLDGHVLVGVDVLAESQVAEVAGSDSPADAEILTHHQHAGSRRPCGARRIGFAV